MKGKFLSISVVVLLLVIAFCGCNEKQTDETATDETENGESQTESFEGFFMDFTLSGGPDTTTGEALMFWSGLTYFLIDDQENRYKNFSSLNEFGNDFELADVVIITGINSTYSGSAAIILEDITYKYPECEDEEPFFVGTWKQTSGILPWSNENAIWYFYEDNSIKIEDKQLTGGNTTGTWNVIECNMKAGPNTYEYEFSNDNTVITLTYEDMEGILTKQS